jgi:sodium transport system permease protein
MVPVTGVALLLQGLMISGTPTAAHWLYFLPVLAPMVIYSWLALRWAIEQFQREEVLFREAERLDLRLWLRSLFREKEPLPSTGQALFFFGMILALRWLSFTVGTHLPLLARTGVSQLAFVAAPALFMTLILTTRPLRGLRLGWPPAWAWPAAVLLAGLLFLPLVELTLFILHQFPGLKLLLEQGNPLTGELQALRAEQTPLSLRLMALVVLGLLPAVCEELAFRGLILTGLARRFRPGTAIFLSSFLFSLYQMNVFQLVPHFVQGVVLALLVLRTGSLWPAMVFHLVNNLLLITPAVFPDVFAVEAGSGLSLGDFGLLRLVLAGTSLAAALGLLAGIWLLSRWHLPESEEASAS